MRLWPFSRPASRVTLTPEDLVAIEDLLHRNVEDVLRVRDRQASGLVMTFRGELTRPPREALAVLLERFRPLGYTPFLRPERGEIVVQAWPAVDPGGRPRVALNVVLFLLTCLSTLAAGAVFFASPTFVPLDVPYGVAALLSGAPFAVTLLAILGVHEFGHYFTARYHQASVSLPFFIPAPPPFLFGTFGAIIRMRSPARDRNSLFDIAAAGPLAGLAIAIPAILIGLQWSTLAEVPPGEYLRFGDPLLMSFLVYLQFGPIPQGMDVFVHPAAIAGWAGLFVTALNLFPVGQLDGGRIAYALFGRGHRHVGVGTFIGLLVLGVVTQSLNWLVWAALLFFLIGFQHTPPLDDVTPLTPRRRLVGVLCLILLVLLIPPVPIEFG
jgi:membrane-associated protease RseP (regulator of RpoE activity)